MKRLRLLILSSSYPRWANDHEPSFVHELARRLIDRFEVKVIAPHAKGALAEESLDGVVVRRFRYAPENLEILVNDGGIINNLRRSIWKWLLVPLFLIAQTWTICRTIHKWRPNIIHAHWLIPQGLIMALLSLTARDMPPYLVTSHGADLHALKFWPLPALKRFVVRRAAAVTVVSSSMLDAMKAQGIPVEGVRVEPMGVDLEDRFTPDESVARSCNEILFVGRLVEKKGLRYLIEAMPDILRKNPDAQLTVAGFGPEESELRRVANGLSIAEKINFLGAVPQERLPTLYRRAAVFVAPFIEAVGGDQEGLGLVTIEAIGCNCPVVISDLPAVRDVVDNKDLRTKPSDTKQLANKVTTVLSLCPDARNSLTRDLRKNASRKFNWEQRGKAYRRLLNALLKQSVKGPT